MNPFRSHQTPSIPSLSSSDNTSHSTSTRTLTSPSSISTLRSHLTSNSKRSQTSGQGIRSPNSVPRSGSITSLLSGDDGSLQSGRARFHDQTTFEEEEDNFFLNRFSRGSFKTQRYHSLDSASLPYFMSYSQGSLNYDSFLNFAFYNAMKDGTVTYLSPDSSATEEKIPPPKRCLNIGGGVPFWELNMAKHPGWEETSFVGKRPSSYVEKIQPNYLHRP